MANKTFVSVEDLKNNIRLAKEYLSDSSIQKSRGWKNKLVGTIFDLEKKCKRAEALGRQKVSISNYHSSIFLIPELAAISAMK